MVIRVHARISLWLFMYPMYTLFVHESKKNKKNCPPHPIKLSSKYYYYHDDIYTVKFIVTVVHDG